MVTSTATNTVAVTAATPTAYAQCQSNNLVGSANGGHGIFQPGIVGYNGVKINQVSGSDPVQCCVNCAQATGCVGYSQFPAGSCYYFTVDASTCLGSSTFDDLYYTRATVPANQGYIIGNGQCGRFGNGGDR